MGVCCQTPLPPLGGEGDNADNELTDLQIKIWTHT